MIKKLATTILIFFSLISKGISDILPYNPVPVNVTDSLALVDLYNNTNGQGWSNNTNWLKGMVYTWRGVFLSKNGRVEYLELEVNNLAGSIPESIGNLSGLFELDLENNQLSGSIPSTIGNLSSLVNLVLDDNQLSGSIPATIGNIPRLATIYFDNNQLTGPLPSSLGNLTSLEILSVSSNQLSGSIPNSIGKLTSYSSFDISYNQFTSLPNLSYNSTNEYYGGYEGIYAKVDDNNLSFSSIIPNLAYL